MQQFMNFNPYMTPQQRIAQMEQQYNMNFAQQPVQTVQQQGYKLVTIGSIEEAKAAPVDTINDTPSFFFNRGKNEIYLISEWIANFLHISACTRANKRSK